MTQLKYGLLYAASLTALLLIAYACPGCGKDPVARAALPVIQSGGTEAAASAEGKPLLPGSGAVPGADELETLLYAELQRLGKDPSSTTSSAPSGSDNVVFDLGAALIDADGPGGDPPTGIALNWTEQLIGDYDQNGLVNASDLTPLGANWQETIEYDDPAMHGGFALWPTGDPDDGTGGATNWRLARVDGNRDGQVYQYDITPIAQHWKEHLSHYRVYAKAPGNSDFTVVETQAPERNGAAPVRCSYDAQVTVAGVYQYYVVPYDDATDQEGPPSSVISVDIATGDVNHAPVAVLTVSPTFAGAPSEITLDATASYDLDGGIAAYRWDFDADGLVDWVSTEPVPETSSDGTVESITPTADGVVTATYTQGSAEWFYPSVAVSDDLSAQSATEQAKLGISGWASELLADPISANIDFSVGAVSHDPATGQVCLAGFVAVNAVPPWAAETAKGVYWARRIGAGQWNIEFVLSFTDPDILGDWDRVDWVAKTHIFWDAEGNPFLAVGVDREFPWLHKYKTAILRISDGDTWQLDSLLEDYLIGDVATAESGEFHFMLAYFVSNSDIQYHLGQYNGVDLHIINTGYYNDPEASQILGVFCLDDENQVHFGISDPERMDWHSLFILDPMSENQWEPRKLLSINDGDYSFLGWEELIFETDIITCLCGAHSKADPIFGHVDNLHIAVVDGSSINARLVCENVDLQGCQLFPLQDGYAVFAPNDPYQEETDEFSINYCQFTKALEIMLTEEIAHLDRHGYVATTRLKLRASHSLPNGRATAIYDLLGAEYGEGSYGVFLGNRVDPRT